MLDKKNEAEVRKVIGRDEFIKSSPPNLLHNFFSLIIFPLLAVLAIAVALPSSIKKDAAAQGVWEYLKPKRSHALVDVGL